MITIALISFGFGLLCCLGIAVPAVALFRAVHRLRPQAPGLRVATYGCAALAAAFAAWWCWLILDTCWQLISKDGGPGPFGLLIFPFWAALAVLPALAGLGLLRLLGRFAGSKPGDR